QKTAPLPVLKSPAGSSPLSIIPLFNGNVLILFYLRSRFFLRNPQFQYAMFEFTLDILLSQIVAYIKASLTGSAETFFPDETSVLCLLWRILLCGNGHIAIFQSNLYIFFLESGKINIQFIAVLLLPDICLHQIFRSPAIELPFHFPIFSIIKKWEIVKIKEIIKPVISKCSRQ